VGERKVHTVSVEKPEEKRPLGRLRRRRENGIRKYLKEIGGGGAWNGFTWLRKGICGGLL
jgi:hypothetical protein